MVRGIEKGEGEDGRDENILGECRIGIGLFVVCIVVCVYLLER
jgi:hypothetical protein